MNTHLAVMYLYRSGTRFNVKTMLHAKHIASITYSSHVGQNRASLFINSVFLLIYTKNLVSEGV